MSTRPTRSAQSGRAGRRLGRSTWKITSRGRRGCAGRRFLNRILTRGCYTVPGQRLCRTDDDAAVVPTEAEAVGDRWRRLPWPGFVENDIDAELRIDVLRAGRW